jgi:hypothetical protein
MDVLWPKIYSLFVFFLPHQVFDAALGIEPKAPFMLGSHMKEAMGRSLGTCRNLDQERECQSPYPTEQPHVGLGHPVSLLLTLPFCRLLKLTPSSRSGVGTLTSGTRLSLGATSYISGRLSCRLFIVLKQTANFSFSNAFDGHFK